jgi:hypothetical protein
MPLVPVKMINPMKSFLKDITDNYKQHIDAAKAFADAYGNYAMDGMALASKPIFTGAEKALMMATIAGALSPNGQAATLASAIQNAVMAYWTAPPVMFMPAPHPGIATAMPGAASIGSAITGILSNTMNTYDSAAAQIATVLHTATITTLVVFTPPPPIPPPPPPAPVL